MGRFGGTALVAATVAGMIGAAGAEAGQTTAGGISSPSDKVSMTLDVKANSVVHLQGWARAVRTGNQSAMSVSISFAPEGVAPRLCAYADGFEWPVDPSHLNANISCLITLQPGRYVLNVTAPNKRADARHTELHYIMVEK